MSYDNLSSVSQNVHPFPCIKKWPKAIRIFEGVMYSFGKRTVQSKKSINISIYH
jgi:hypothetical protein